MQRDAPGEDSGEAEKRCQIEHVRADHDSGADAGLMPAERRHRGRDFGSIGRKRRQHAEQRLRQTQSRTDAFKPGHEQPTRQEANCRAAQEDDEQ